MFGACWRYVVALFSLFGASWTRFAPLAPFCWRLWSFLWSRKGCALPLSRLRFFVVSLCFNAQATRSQREISNTNSKTRQKMREEERRAFGLQLHFRAGERRQYANRDACARTIGNARQRRRFAGLSYGLAGKVAAFASQYRRRLGRRKSRKSHICRF